MLVDEKLDMPWPRPHSPESQESPGPAQAGAEGWDHPPLPGSGETPPAELPPASEGRGAAGASPEEATKMRRAGSPVGMLQSKRQLSCTPGPASPLQGDKREKN